jgi:hypothetical protein
VIAAPTGAGGSSGSSSVGESVKGIGVNFLKDTTNTLAGINDVLVNDLFNMISPWDVPSST